MLNRVNDLFGIKYPIVQGGMIWCSGWELASAVSNAGGLGLIGSGSMYPDILREQIKKCRQATGYPFGVNIPLLYEQVEEHMHIIVEEGVKIVFTSAGNPKTWTSFLKENGITVVHVVSSSQFAAKSQDAGVDAVVGEGFEAGGHNGRDETTTMCLIPAMRKIVDIPIIAAGGISGGAAMLAALALGAEAVQVGSLFAASKEASGHDHFKQRIIETKEGDTKLSLKSLVPVRLIKNGFYEQIEALESKGATKEELAALLGKGRSKKGMFEGDVTEGELEIGEVSALIDEIKPAGDIVAQIWKEFQEAKARLSQ